MRIAGIPVRRTASATFYQVQNDGNVLQILGEIEAGFAQKLRKAIAENPSVKTVSLGSAGGSVYEALEAGRFIRKSGLSTTLWNNCYSACPLVFAGGKDRTIWSPYPSLGFHKVYAKTGAVPVTSQVYRDIQIYLLDMGIAPGFFIGNMIKAEPEEIYLVPVLTKSFVIAILLHGFKDFARQLQQDVKSRRVWSQSSV